MYVHTISLVKYLLTQFQKYWVELCEINNDLINLTAQFSKWQINLWKDLGTGSFVGKDRKPHSIFQVDSTHSE